MADENSEPKKNKKILVLIILLFVVVVVVLFARQSLFVPSETSPPQESVEGPSVHGEKPRAFIRDLKFSTTDLTAQKKADLQFRTSNLQYRIETVE